MSHAVGETVRGFITTMVGNGFLVALPDGSRGLMRASAVAASSDELEAHRKRVSWQIRHGQPIPLTVEVTGEHKNAPVKYDVSERLVAVREQVRSVTPGRMFEGVVSHIIPASKLLLVRILPLVWGRIDARGLIDDAAGASAETRVKEMTLGKRLRVAALSTPTIDADGEVRVRLSEKVAERFGSHPDYARTFCKMTVGSTCVATIGYQFRRSVELLMDGGVSAVLHKNGVPQDTWTALKMGVRVKIRIAQRDEWHGTIDAVDSVEIVS